MTDHEKASSLRQLSHDKSLFFFKSKHHFSALCFNDFSKEMDKKSPAIVEHSPLTTCSSVPVLDTCSPIQTYPLPDGPYDDNSKYDRVENEDDDENKDEVPSSPTTVVADVRHRRSDDSCSSPKPNAFSTTVLLQAEGAVLKARLKKLQEENTVLKVRLKNLQEELQLTQQHFLLDYQKASKTKCLFP
jgi:hypothetical protein